MSNAAHLQSADGLTSMGPFPADQSPALHADYRKSPEFPLVDLAAAVAWQSRAEHAADFLRLMQAVLQDGAEGAPGFAQKGDYVHFATRHRDLLLAEAQREAYACGKSLDETLERITGVEGAEVLTLAAKRDSARWDQVAGRLTHWAAERVAHAVIAEHDGVVQSGMVSAIQGRMRWPSVDRGSALRPYDGREVTECRTDAEVYAAWRRGSIVRVTEGQIDLTVTGDAAPALVIGGTAGVRMDIMGKSAPVVLLEGWARFHGSCTEQSAPRFGIDTQGRATIMARGESHPRLAIGRPGDPASASCTVDVTARDSSVIEASVYGGMPRVNVNDQASAFVGSYGCAELRGYSEPRITAHDESYVHVVARAGGCAQAALFERSRGSVTGLGDGRLLVVAGEAARVEMDVRDRCEATAQASGEPTLVTHVSGHGRADLTLMRSAQCEVTVRDAAVVHTSAQGASYVHGRTGGPKSEVTVYAYDESRIDGLTGSEPGVSIHRMEPAADLDVESPDAVEPETPEPSHVQSDREAVGFER